MEFMRKQVHMSRLKEQKSMQIMFDEDILLSDDMPDAADVLMCNGLIVQEVVKPGTEKLNLRGALSYRVLLVSTAGTLFAKEGEVPYQEVMNYPGLTEKDNVGTCHWSIEDIRASIVNDRKLRLNGVANCVVSANEVVSEDAVTGLADADDESIFAKTKKCQMLQLMVQNHDSLRVKEEIDLPGNQPNIAKILWKDVSLYQVDYQVLEGKLQAAGELEVFVMYMPEEANMPVQCFEKRVPFSGELDYSACQMNQIPMVGITLSSYEVEGRPDYDGENRMLSVDAVLDLAVKCYQEGETELLADAYEIGYHYDIAKRDASFDSLIMKNMASCKINEAIELDERVLQVCHCHGKVNIDSMTVQPGENGDDAESGIRIEGSLELSIIYMGAEEDAPIHVYFDVVSFNCTLEAGGLEGVEPHIEIVPYLSALSIVPTGGRKAEVRAVVMLDAFVTKTERCEVIDTINRSEMTEADWEQIPGLCGYMIQEQDDLWEIARRFQTSAEHIRALNGLSGSPKQGDRILVVKEVRQ